VLLLCGGEGSLIGYKAWLRPCLSILLALPLNLSRKDWLVFLLFSYINNYNALQTIKPLTAYPALPSNLIIHKIEKVANIIR
jgi:hypothetical protein